MIGDTINLQYPSQNVSGSKFGYSVKGTAVSFGTIIALAGDYYYDWNDYSCHETISDSWDSNKKKSIETAKANVHLLSSDNGTILHCLLELIEEQKNIASAALKSGKDPVQVGVRFFISSDS